MSCNVPASRWETARFAEFLFEAFELSSHPIEELMLFPLVYCQPAFWKWEELN